MKTTLCRFPLLLLTTAAGLAAQTETSPKGLLSTEANSNTTPFGAKSYVSSLHTHFTQVDSTLVGAGSRSIGTLRFRRDGTSATNTSAIGRGLNVEVRMGNASWSKVKNGTLQFDSDWRVGSWSAVLAPKPIVLPDLRTAPATAPAPWSIQLPLDTPFSYGAANALALQIHLMPNNLPSDDLAYVLDAHLGQLDVQSQGVSYGTACTMTGLATPLLHNASLTNHGDVGSSTSAQFAIYQAKPSTQCVLFLGMSDPNLAFGGCASLRCSPEVVLTGSTNGSGSGAFSLYFAHQPSYIGLQLRSQIAVLDAGKTPIPVALSNARVTTYPQSPVFQKNVASGWLWSSVTGWSASAKLYKDSALVIGF